VKVSEYRWIHANSIIPTNRSMDKFAKRLEARDVAGTSGNSSADYLVRTTYRSFPPVVPRVSTPRGYEGSEGLGRGRERERERGRKAERPAGRLKYKVAANCSSRRIYGRRRIFADFPRGFPPRAPISRTARLRPIIPPRTQFTRDSLRSRSPLSSASLALQLDVNEIIDSV
jgi:hypothetical protein